MAETAGNGSRPRLGVAERFNRTLKEQAIYGRVFRNAEKVRAPEILPA
jgi:hypothetical protein